MLAADLTRTLIAIAVLVAIAVIAMLAVRAPTPWASAVAVARGVLQLAVISVILSGIISSPWWIAAALLVMFTVAASTAARRLGDVRSRLLPVATSMAAGILLTGTIVFGFGAIMFTPRYVLAVGGIIIGNSMTIATLSGRRLVELVDDHWDEVEGWLALGARPRQATLTLVRRAVHAAIVPTVDQTKTTGLVTLPGAFVGAIFGGVSPVEAGRFQIVVLAAIIGAGSIVAVTLTAWLAPMRTRPGPL